MPTQSLIASLTLAALAVASALASAQAQTLPPPPAGRYLCGVGSAPRPPGATSATNYGSSQGRLTLDGANYLYETDRGSFRGAYRYDGTGKVLFDTGELAGSTAGWERSPWGNQPGRFWFKGNYCDLSTG